MLSPAETVMFSLGMKSPASRFIGMFAITNLLVLYFKPSYLQDSSIPWWTPGLVIGGLAAALL
jgi:hypothetical protein